MQSDDEIKAFLELAEKRETQALFTSDAYTGQAFLHAPDLAREVLRLREEIFKLGSAYGIALMNQHELIRQLRNAGCHLEESASMHKCATKNMSLETALARWKYIKAFATEAAEAAQKVSDEATAIKEALEAK